MSGSDALSAAVDLSCGSAQQRACDDAERTLGEVGRRVRMLRQRRRLTLQEFAALVRLSPSMLSLVERGRASPSLTTLAALAHGFGISLTDLIAGRHVPEDEVVIRMADQPAIETSDRVLRRVLKQDTLRKIDITHNEYGPGIGNSPSGVIHTGHEYGLVLEGELTVEVDGNAHVLRPGDLLSLRSTRQHKIWNYGAVPAKAIWFNVQKVD